MAAERVTLDDLTVEFELWGQTQGIPMVDAAEMIAAECDGEGNPLTPAQLEWLVDFSSRWDEVSDAEDADRAIEQRAADESMGSFGLEPVGLPATIPFLPAFLNTFEHVLDTGYNALRSDPEGLDADDLRVQLANAIDETLTALAFTGPEEGDSTFMAALHDAIDDAYPEIAQAITDTTDQGDEE